MRIESKINYWDEGVLTFDPEKVLENLKKYFLLVEIDQTDYSWQELQRIIKLANEKEEEPTRSIVINQAFGKYRANGPSFRFKILLNTESEITGCSQRYHIEFNSKHGFDSETEVQIIDFLKTLNYGQISSDTETNLFAYPSKEIQGDWTLTE